MRVLISGLVLVTAMLVASCSRMLVKHDFDPTVDFTPYQTYSWLETAGGDGIDSLVDVRIRSAVERELATRGLFKSTGPNADLLISYEGRVEEKKEVVTHNYDYWRGAPVETYTNISSQREGTLIIDIIDSKLRRVIWRGWATAVLGDGPADEKLINEAVANILASYPPK